MKKLQKIKLNDASLMNENEMKRVVGSFRGTAKTCPRGNNEQECATSCEIEATNQYGDSVLIAGECHYVVGFSCGCFES